MRWLVAVAVVVAAVTVGVAYGWRWVFGPLLGYVIYRAGTSMLRGMAAGRGPTGGGDSSPEPVLHSAERTLYWCEHCGAELLLVVKGTETPPRHCGESMHMRREEIAR